MSLAVDRAALFLLPRHKLKLAQDTPMIISSWSPRTFQLKLWIDMGEDYIQNADIVVLF